MRAKQSSDDLVPPTLLDGGAEMLEWLKRMRQEHPVLRDENGCYGVFRYNDVKQVINDSVTFSNDQRRVIPGLDDFAEVSLAWNDPPNHTRFRGLVNQAFTARTVRTLEPLVVEFSDQLLDDLSGTDEFDLINDFALPLPAIVIAELLGVPASDHEMFQRSALNLLAANRQGADVSTQTRAAFTEVTDYLRDICRERRLAPRDDMISGLLTARAGGVGFTDDECARFCVILLLSGFMTTTALIGNTVLCLDENPDATAKLREDRSLIPGAIEEVLRHRPPVPSVMRIPFEDAEVAGVSIPAGSVVMASLLSANHDESRIARPEWFDITRAPNPHLAFGHGIHFCIGAPLARMEGAIALDALLTRFRDFGPIPGNSPEFYEQGVLQAKHIPLRVSR